MLALLLGTWLVAPGFYLRHVLQAEARETQIVEFITFGSGFAAGLLLLWCTWRLWRRRAQFGWLAPGTVGMIALASVFFAGEEVSWGQTYFGWETPPEYKAISYETNLHNVEHEIELPLPFLDEPLVLRPSVQGLGSLFIITMFIAVPLLWRLKGHGGLPANLEPAIAEAPVVWCVAVAFIWKFVKDGYRALSPGYEEQRFYQEFMEQINEHKEMLIAVALLMYGLYRVRWVRVHAAPR